MTPETTIRKTTMHITDGNLGITIDKNEKIGLDRVIIEKKEKLTAKSKRIDTFTLPITAQQIRV